MSHADTDRLTSPSRPPAVVAYLRRPLWWAAGVAVFLTVMVVADARRVALDNGRFDRSHRVVGAITGADAGVHVVDITYQESATGREVVAASVVRDVQPFPASGSRVELEVSDLDPAAVRLVEDRRAWSEDLAYDLGALFLPLAFAMVRRRHIRMLERLMASSATTYVMSARVVPPSGFRRRWLLLLYPWDASDDRPPVCAVALIAPPESEVHRRIEVKGDVRPYGQLAIRVGDEVLWPRGRALGRVPALEVRRSPIDALASRVLRGRTQDPRRRGVSRVLLAGGLLFLLAGFWASAEHAAAAERVLDRSRPAHAVVAAVEGATDVNPRLQVTFRVGDEDVRTVVASRGDVPGIGSTVDVRYDVMRPSDAWRSTDSRPPASGSDLDAIATIAGLLALVAFALVR